MLSVLNREKVMKLRKVLFFSFVFAALVFCISCKGKGDKYDEFDDWDTDMNDNDSGDTSEDSDINDSDTATDTEPDSDSDTGDNDSEIPDEPNETDHDRIDDNDSRPQEDEDHNTDQDEEPLSDDDTDTTPDETPEEPADEDSIPETEEPATICTGQNKCYSNKNNKELACPASPDADFFGQDAQYANKGYCISKTFSTTSDTVEDNITGLVWQRKLPETGCPNHAAGTNIIVCTKQEAVDYCNNLSYAGESDWRLPSPEEFATIKNFGSIPAIYNTDDTEYFPLPSTTETIFWTSASSLASSGKSWAVDFNTGETIEKDDTKASSTFYVRCVRGEGLAKPDFKTFSENEEVVIYDDTNNLKWTKTIGNEVTWKAALKYCEDLEYAGETNWRLPNINELASLIDYSRYNPASQFPGINSLNLWSSTSYIGYTSSAWIADMSSGTVLINNGKTLPFKVICVK